MAAADSALHHAWAALLAAASLLVAGCATVRAPRLTSPAAQEALLRGLSGFELTGVVGVRAGDQGANPTLNWTQRGDEASVHMYGPFGAGNLKITWSPRQLQMATGDDVYEGELAEHVLVDNLGFVPPFAALRYWVLGLAAPGDVPEQQETGVNGRLKMLVQQQWRITYDSWVRVGIDGDGVEVPRRLVATRDDVRLTVVVRRWRL